MTPLGQALERLTVDLSRVGSPVVGMLSTGLTAQEIDDLLLTYGWVWSEPPPQEFYDWWQWQNGAKRRDHGPSVGASILQWSRFLPLDVQLRFFSTLRTDMPEWLETASYPLLRDSAGSTLWLQHVPQDQSWILGESSVAGDPVSPLNALSVGWTSQTAAGGAFRSATLLEWVLAICAGVEGGWLVVNSKGALVGDISGQVLPDGTPRT